MEFESALDAVQLRSGSFLLGTVMNRSFTMRMEGSSTEITVRNAEVLQLVVADPGQGDPRDRLVLVSGSQLFGTVTDETLDVRMEGTSTVTAIPMRDVLAAQLTFSMFVG